MSLSYLESILLPAFDFAVLELGHDLASDIESEIPQIPDPRGEPGAVQCVYRIRCGYGPILEEPLEDVPCLIRRYILRRRQLLLVVQSGILQ